MPYYDWDEAKNEKLKEERNISFEEVVEAIISGNTLDSFAHPNQKKYLNQKIAIVEINKYAYIVAYLETEEKFFLKTIYPNREATKKYIIERNKR